MPYFPLTVIGSSLVNQISDALPSGAAFDALPALLLGHFPGYEALGVLAGYMVVFTAAAVRWFGWDVEQLRKRHGAAARVATRALTAPALSSPMRLPARSVSLATRALTRSPRSCGRAFHPATKSCPGRKMKRSLLGEESAGPDYIMVQGGMTGFWRAEVHIVRGTGGTRLQVKLGGDPVYRRIGVARKVGRALRRSIS
jgi:hypothetical protein